MYQVHEVDRKPWISNKTIKLSDSEGERGSLLRCHGVTLEPEPFTDHETNLDKLLHEFVESNEKDLKPYFSFPSSDERTLHKQPECKLKMYTRQLEHAKQMISDRHYRISYLSQLNTTRREMLMRHLAAYNRHSATNDSVDQEPIPSNVLAIRGAHDLAAVVVVQIWSHSNGGNKIRLDKEVLFRSDQLLTELRDQFKCQRDYGVPMDLSENPTQAERIYRRELFKSGFFLIGSTFYDDMRDASNVALSRQIIEWSEQEVAIVGPDGDNIRAPRGIGPFSSSTMESSTFADVEFRLGCPYLYLHQGDCEHLFVISDVRYVPHKHLNSVDFPHITASTIGSKADNLLCYMCKSRPPHWYTINNNRLPVSPFFFCESCFYSYNYDAQKRKIGSFQAYLFTSTLGIPDSIPAV